MNVISEEQAERLYIPTMYAMSAFTIATMLCSVIAIPFTFNQVKRIPSRINIMFFSYVLAWPILILVRVIWLWVLPDVYGIRLLGNTMVFFLSVLQVEMMLELLKLFTILSTIITKKMIYHVQIGVACLNPILNGGLFLYGNQFQSSLEKNWAAMVSLINKWFRFGFASFIVLSNIIYIVILVLVFTWMSNDFIRKNNQVNAKVAIQYFIAISILCVLCVVVFLLALFVNGDAGTYLEKMYQQLILLVLSIECLWAFLMPFVFEAIKRLKFTREQIEKSKLSKVSHAKPST